jgi:hypothetical protein
MDLVLGFCARHVTSLVSRGGRRGLNYAAAARTPRIFVASSLMCSSMFIIPFELAQVQPFRFFETFLPLPANQNQAFASFWGLYRINVSLSSAAGIPCGASSFRALREHVKKVHTPSAEFPPEGGGATGCDTSWGCENAGKASTVLSAALSNPYQCGRVALVRQSSKVQAYYHCEWSEFNWPGEKVRDPTGSIVQTQKRVQLARYNLRPEGRKSRLAAQSCWRQWSTRWNKPPNAGFCLYVCMFCLHVQYYRSLH